VNDDVTRQAIKAHFEAIGRDPARAAEIYADDAVLEFPAGRERIPGKAGIVASRQAYPDGPASFEVHRVLGAGDLWVCEMTLRFDGDHPHSVAAILELRDGKVVREAMYVADPFDPPAHRAQWSERMDPREGN
jgi:ketosteroid isomerase-like protein